MLNPFTNVSNSIRTMYCEDCYKVCWCNPVLSQSVCNVMSSGCLLVWVNIPV